MTVETKRTAIVTGASRGLGAAIAMELAAAGRHVAVNYFNSRDAAEAVCRRISESGGVAVPFKADVCDELEVATMIEAVRASLGEPEILVVNATGPQPMLSIEEQTWQSYMDQLEFFVKSPLLLLHEVLPGMRQSGFGRIVQIGSEVVELGNANFANYVAAKGAQLGQTRSWATELAPHGITVNLVAPGWIPTERHTDATQADMDTYAAGVPMLRMGQAEDVGRMVAYLCSDEARFITGQKFAVNGGNTLL
jgi:3-oxoacyl-[acyl-carrier protein] reductase